MCLKNLFTLFTRRAHMIHAQSALGIIHAERALAQAEACAFCLQLMQSTLEQQVKMISGLAAVEHQDPLFSEQAETSQTLKLILMLNLALSGTSTEEMLKKCGNCNHNCSSQPATGLCPAADLPLYHWLTYNLNVERPASHLAVTMM